MTSLTPRFLKYIRSINIQLTLIWPVVATDPTSQPGMAAVVPNMASGVEEEDYCTIDASQLILNLLLVTLRTARPGDLGRPVRPWILTSSWLGVPVWQRASLQQETPDRVPSYPLRTPVQYTDEEYSRYLINPGWSREETDYMMELVNQFHERFPIVADRYEPARNRTVVDIKERYYQVLNAVNSARGKPNAHFNFDGDWERKRRLQIESFQARPQAELQEELYLLDEIGRTSERLEEILAVREQVMRRFGNAAEWVTPEGLPLTIPDLVAGTVSRKKSSAGLPSSVKPIATSTKTSSVKKTADTRKRSISQSQSGLGSRSQSVESVSVAPKASAGPGRKPKPFTFPTSLASARITPIRVGLCRHVDRMMLDYGLPVRPSVATPPVVEAFDRVRVMLADLAEMKKALEALSNPSASLDKHQ